MALEIVPSDELDDEIDSLLPSDAELLEERKMHLTAIREQLAASTNTISVAQAVRARLAPLTDSVVAGEILEASMVKLGLDILAGNLKPRSVREAADAIEALSRVTGMLKGGRSDEVFTRASRDNIFNDVKIFLQGAQPMSDKSKSMIDAVGEVMDS